MHHLAVFSEQLAISANYAQIGGVADGGLPRNSADAYIMPSAMRIIAAHVQGLTTSRCQIQAPSLRNVAYPEIAPIQQTVFTTAPSNANFRMLGDFGPTLLQNETLQLAGSNSSGAAVSDTVAGLWLAPRFTPAPPGPIHTLVATTSNTLVVAAWTLSTLTFETVLAAGQYAVVGMRVQCADANYARLVFPGTTNLRPGCLVVAAAGDSYKYDQFRNGNLGMFGTFDFNAPPQLEVFGSAAGAETATVFLDLIKVR